MDKVQNFVDDEMNSTPGCTVKFTGFTVAGHLVSGHYTVHCRCTMDV